MADAPELLEDVALAVEHRKYVLEVFARLPGLTHYELLGVARDADKAALRRAYFDLARFIHPDRYFGKNLGSFKPKLDAIFARLTKAYETLSETDQRARYDAALANRERDNAALPGAIAPDAAPARPLSAADQAKRKAVFEALRQRVEGARSKLADELAAAGRARAAGDLSAALEAYRRALALAPGDASVKSAHDELAVMVRDRRCDAHRRQAALAEGQQRWQQAAASWQLVADARPDDVEARARLAAALARVGDPAKR